MLGIDNAVCKNTVLVPAQRVQQQTGILAGAFLMRPGRVRFEAHEARQLRGPAHGRQGSPMPKHLPAIDRQAVAQRRRQLGTVCGRLERSAKAAKPKQHSPLRKRIIQDSTAL